MQSFPPSDLVSCAGIVLVTDQLPAPADFLLHRFLHVRLKEMKQSDCIFLSMSEDLWRIKAVASKAVLTLGQNPKFTFIDIAKCIEAAESSVGNGSRLRPIVDLLSSTFASKGQNLVILDDVASLEWLGFSSLEVFRFARALSTLCSKTGSTLVIRHHIMNAAEPDALFQLLLQLCSYHVEVRPLASGRSGAVSGEICLHPGPSMDDPNHRSIPRTTALQYRLTDGGAIFFNKGTSEGVL